MEIKVEQGNTLTLKYFPDDPPGLVNKGCSEWIAHDYAELHKVLAVGKAVAIDDGLLSLADLDPDSEPQTKPHLPRPLSPGS